MNARIRYGLETVVIDAIPGPSAPEAERQFIAAMGRTILSFSNRVRNLPDTDGFDPLLHELGIEYTPDHLEQGDGKGAEGSGLFIPGNRFIEVKNPMIIDSTNIKQLGDGLLDLALTYGTHAAIGSNYIIFLDHSRDPLGEEISYYDPLLDQIV
jgi:hypothetical protein